MKKIVLFFMMASASLMVFADNKNISKEESLARKNYFKAVDYFEAGDAKSALKYVDLAEKALNKTNARLSYVKAKALYQQGNLVETQKACSKYFSSNPSTSLITHIIAPAIFHNPRSRKVSFHL